MLRAASGCEDQGGGAASGGAGSSKWGAVGGAPPSFSAEPVAAADEWPARAAGGA